ncbi:unnamed protein product [Vitrella brassicaformis CCMP3155]|uniref:Ribosomal RNA large subunit methyltransferase K/L-like methyltransferase domain-containing protein n=1 Tax=Vitrella brassicaformis (strain CCMP3155) TaxID=1169540 RepID=A0A0G4ESM2_VITBC|nr:unnamed protein product [Vitrella brassicaformis CCMP3155]|eukprot:CEM01002.1 unnamed protein product [Vitrella brassicaformis CCMP3155]
MSDLGEWPAGLYKELLRHCPFLIAVYAFVGSSKLPPATDGENEGYADLVLSQLRHLVDQSGRWSSALTLKRMVLGGMRQEEGRTAPSRVRASCLRDGWHGGLTSETIMRQMSSWVHQKTGWIPSVRPDPSLRHHTLLCLVSYQETFMLLSLEDGEGHPHASIPMEQRPFLVSGTDRRVRLRPSTAHLMVRLALEQKRGRQGEGLVWLDPFCGIGTILLEAATVDRKGRMIGVDSDAACIDAFAANIQAAKDRQTTGDAHLSCYVGNALALSSTLPPSTPHVDMVVTDLPFHHRTTLTPLATTDTTTAAASWEALMDGALGEMMRVVHDDGVIVMLGPPRMAKWLTKVMRRARGNCQLRRPRTHAAPLPSHRTRADSLLRAASIVFNASWREAVFFAAFAGLWKGLTFLTVLFKAPTVQPAEPAPRREAEG